MAINTIDGFYIGSATPIDTRITAADSTERTSIVYKYDGLKVLQLDTRENWIWNQTLSIWQLDSNATDISGPADYLSKYVSGSGLTHSEVYSVNDKVGIRTSSPMSVFQIDGFSGDNFNIYLDSTNGVMMSTNWYYHFDTITGVYSVAKPSVQLKLSVHGGVSIHGREANGAVSAFTKYFEINDANNFNYLLAPAAGTFVSGSASFGTGTSPYSTQQLVYVDGSMRSNSSMHKGIVWIYFNGVNYARRRAYSTTGVLPGGNTTIGTSYTIASYENEVVIHSTVDSADVSLPTLGGTTHDMGREITITLEGVTGAGLNISSATDILDLNGDSYSPTISRGDSIKFMSIVTSDGIWWKTMSHVLASGTYPEVWKSIGAGGTMLNGEAVPNFHVSNQAENSGISGRQDLRIRKIDEQTIHVQGSLKVNGYDNRGGNLWEVSIFAAPTGYKPQNNIYIDASIDDDTSELYTPGTFAIDSGGIYKFLFYQLGIAPHLGDSYLNLDVIVPID